MKISELSQRTGVPLPTIKFYIREGLLPPGQKTGRNQAFYDSKHLERLALIRSLRDDAGLPVDVIAAALNAADTAKDDFIIDAIDALHQRHSAAVDSSSPEYQQAETLVLRVAHERGWDARVTDISVCDAACAVAVAARSFPYTEDAQIHPYFDAAEAISEHEIPDDWDPDAIPDAALRYAVLGTVLFEPVILALRRMAHVARTRRLSAARRAGALKKRG